MATFTTDAKICIERDIVIPPKKSSFDDIVRVFDIKETCKWITENNFERVCLQFPDDLIGVSAAIYHEIKKNIDVDLYILGDTSYGSCCTDSVAAMHVNANAIVHYGHCCFTETNIPVFIVLPKEDIDMTNAMSILQNNFNNDNNVKFCLFYGAEYEHCKDEMTKEWFKQFPSSYMAFIEPEDKPNRRMGRVIKSNTEECSFDVLKETICVYIGSRGQTLFNCSISIPAKEWYHVNLSTLTVDPLEETMWLRRRRYLIEKCKDANTVGILVCKLSGEQTKDIISRMKQICKVNGKKSYIVSVGKPNVAKLANFPEIDIYVLIACPENDLYSNRDFYKPLVYPYELEVALNSNREQYFTSCITDYDELLPGKRYHCDIDRVKETYDVSLITGKVRETHVETEESNNMELAEKQNWALQNIGQSLQERSWKGLEQKLGETEIKNVEQGRQGIPLQYSNEPE